MFGWLTQFFTETTGCAATERSVHISTEHDDEEITIPVRQSNDDSSNTTPQKDMDPILTNEELIARYPEFANVLKRGIEEDDDEYYSFELEEMNAHYEDEYDEYDEYPEYDGYNGYAESD